MLEPTVLPTPWRQLNTLGRGAFRVGLQPVALTPGRLTQVAERQTGLHDFGGDDYLDPLALLCTSANEDARLTLLGRFIVRDAIVRSLASRLRRIHLKKTRPEIFKTPLIPPVMVLGLPRSGTTALHRLLACAPDARPLKMWELMQPIGPEKGPDNRRAQGIESMQRLHKVAPQLAAKHYTHADEPEECVLLLNSSLQSVAFWMYAPVFSYMEWLRDLPTEAFDSAYEIYRENLQIFQFATPNKRLTLKAPAHMACIASLLRAIPDARIVHTIRNPEPVIGSVNSLFYTIHGIMTDDLQVERMARTNLSILASGSRKLAEAVPNIPANQYFDVRFEQIVQEPVDVAIRIFEHFGLDASDAVRALLEAHHDNRPQHKFGKHVYALEDCGITADDVRREMRPYIEAFLPADG